MKEIKVDVLEIILAVEILTVLRLTGLTGEKLKNEIEIRYHEVRGVLQLARRLGLDDYIIKEITDHGDGLKRTLDKAQ